MAAVLAILTVVTAALPAVEDVITAAFTDTEVVIITVWPSSYTVTTSLPRRYCHNHGLACWRDYCETALARNRDF
jgi:hypothetical protein